MSLPFSRDEVRGHLTDLGFQAVSEAQLDNFIVDLKRLIRYEEKKKNKALKRSPSPRVLRGRRPSRSPRGLKARNPPQDDDESAYSSSSSVRSESPASSRRGQRSRYEVKRSSTKVFGREEAKILHETRKAKIVVIEDSDDDDKVEVRVRVPSDKEEMTSAKPERPRKRVNERIKPSRPTTSFIRSRSLSRGQKGDFRSDPVLLHQYYQRIWQKTKFPGDESAKNLRWRVREFMAHQS